MYSEAALKEKNLVDITVLQELNFDWGQMRINLKRKKTGEKTLELLRLNLLVKTFFKIYYIQNLFLITNAEHK